MVIENRELVAWGGDRNVLLFDWSSGYTGVYICPNSTYLKIYILCK